MMLFFVRMKPPPIILRPLNIDIGNLLDTTIIMPYTFEFQEYALLFEVCASKFHNESV